jgi:hypothetical protein
MRRLLNTAIAIETTPATPSVIGTTISRMPMRVLSAHRLG